MDNLLHAIVEVNETRAAYGEDAHCGIWDTEEHLLRAEILRRLYMTAPLPDTAIEDMTVFQLCGEQRRLNDALTRVSAMMQKRSDENLAVIKADGRYIGPPGEY